jgi:hypothetical protein
MRGMVLLGVLVLGRPALAEPCGPRVEPQIIEALRARQFLDAHVLARTAAAYCAASAEALYRRYDALALLGLDDLGRAREQLGPALGSDDPILRQDALALHAWTFLRERDDDAFHRALQALPEAPRLRLRVLEHASDRDQARALAAGLEPRLRAGALAGIDEVWAGEHTRRPWLAATLSAVLPGAGQAYAGSWQGAAVAFALNGLLISATVELAWKRLYLAASAAGAAASFFYVGNVINAADLATRRNEMAAAPARLALESRLLPEAHP